MSVRQITDSKVLAAMSHPLRRRLLDLLRVDGPSTASVLSERTGSAVGNVSHHLKALAAAGLIEEAPGLARDRRERWWQLVSRTMRWSTRDFEGDEAAEAITLAAASIDLDSDTAHARAWFAAGPADREHWGDAPFATRHWLTVTPAELAEVQREVVAVLTRWSDREIPDDGQERGTAIAVARGVPARP